MRNIVTRSFDAADRVVSETDALGDVTQYQYDAAGNVIAVIDPEQHTSRFEYDAMNRKSAIIDANGARTQTVYNLRGDVMAVTNAMNESTTFQYDAIGRKTQTTDAHGYVTTFAYDANGNLTCAIDANAQTGLQPKNSDGCTASTAYDELNRPVLVRDALNGTTATTYDLAGHALSQVDAEGRNYQWAYDGLGRLNAETDFSGQTTTYQTDQASNIYQKTNRLGEVSQITYDQLNRPTVTRSLKDNSTETLVYNPSGTVYSSANSSPTSAVLYTFAWDHLNRLLSKNDIRGRSLAFSYDQSGNVLTKTTYQGSTTAYTYDSANRLVNASNPDYLSINYQYDAAGRLQSRVMSSGARSLYSDDNGGWMNRLQHFGASIADTTYTRDRLGHITSQTDVTGTTVTTLDALYRLTKVDAPGTANDEAFSYDRIGNRLIATRGSATVGATGAGITSKYSIYTPATQTGSPGYTPTYNNRLKETRIGSTTGPIDSSFSFDTEGRLTTQTGSGAKTLAWDAKGRVSSVTTGSSTETYGYDPSDHRIKRTGGVLGNRDYFLEGDHLESVYSGSQLQEKYFRGSTIDELVTGYTMQSGTLTAYLFQHDAVMSVSATSNPNGGTQSTQKFWAFGETQATTGTPVTRLKYTGREEDGTGLYQYRARYYDPSIGRFISEDPLKFQAGVNFYAYVGNDPGDANDPSGLMPNTWQDWKNLGSATLGVIGNAFNVAGGIGLITGGSAVAAAGPEGFNKVAGIAVIGFGSTQVAKGAGGVALNASNAVDAWNNRPASLPSSLPRLLAEGYAPGNRQALAAADLYDVGSDIATLKVPVGGYSNSVGSFVRQNTMEIDNWNAATKSIGNLPLTVAAPGTSIGTATNVLSTLFGGGLSSYDWYSGTACTTCSAATGGSLYPNKPNNNQVQSVYHKP